MLTDDTKKRVEVILVVKTSFAVDELGEEFEAMLDGLEEVVDEITITSIELKDD